MKVRTLMRVKPKIVHFDTPLYDVWDLVARRQIHIVPVIGPNGNLRGIITAEDILKNLVPDYRDFFSEFYPQAPTIKDIVDQIQKQRFLTAKDVMNKTVYTVNHKHDVFKALSRMMAYNVRILPVVNDQDKIVGFIVEKDIFKYLFQKKKDLLKKMKMVKKKEPKTKESKLMRFYKK